MASPKKQWLVDAHNVMHKIPELKNKLGTNHLEAMREFCVMTAAAARRQHLRATLVFDGPQQTIGSFSGANVLFSGGRTADDVIIQKMEAKDAAQRWILVSDDREIRQKAYYFHVEILRSEVFAGLLAYRQPKTSGPKSSGSKPASGSGIADPGEKPNPDTGSDMDMFLEMFTKKKR